MNERGPIPCRYVTEGRFVPTDARYNVHHSLLEANVQEMLVGFSILDIRIRMQLDLRLPCGCF